MSDETKAPENLADEFWQLFKRWVTSDIPALSPMVAELNAGRLLDFIRTHHLPIEAALRRATPDQEPALAEVIGHEEGWVLMLGNYVVDGYGFDKASAVRDAESINTEYQRMRAEGTLP